MSQGERSIGLCWMEMGGHAKRPPGNDDRVAIQVLARADGGDGRADEGEAGRSEVGFREGVLLNERAERF